MTRHLPFAHKARLLVVAGALLLASAPSAAGATGSPAPGHGLSAPAVNFVPAATLPSEALHDLNHPVPLDEYRPDSGATTPALAPRAIRSAVAAGNEETDLREQCIKHKEAAASKGWLKSRFETCQHRPFDLVMRDMRGTQEIGRLWFDVWVLGFATDGARRVDFVSSVENIRVQTAPGSGADARNWTVGQYFSHTSGLPSGDPSSTVTPPKKESRDELLGVWDKQPQWTLTYTSPDAGPQWSKGNLQLVESLIMTELTVNAPDVTPYKQVDAYHSNVRFDYAGPIAGKHKGTVFTEGRAELALSLKDPAVNESAQHILDAQKNPERTFPSWPGKSVPGAKEPLHRLIDTKKQEANREKSISECTKVWGNYAGTPLQCDEYPFASTREGSTKGDNRYSVRLIDGTDNETGGRRLNSVYTANRILDGDPFFVKITS